MTIEFVDKLIDAFIQLIVFGVLEGAATWLYARLQRNRELRLQVLREFSALHGRFLSLRFQFNSFYIEWPSKQQSDSQPLNDSDLSAEKWRCYKEACNLWRVAAGTEMRVSIRLRPPALDRRALAD